jgi:outer membrane protein TolC
LPAAPVFSEDANVLITLARGHRLDLQALGQAALAGEAEIQLEYLQIFPEILLGVGAERNEGRALPGQDIPADFARSSLRAGEPTMPDIQTRGERNAERSQDIEFKIGPSLAMTLPIFDQNQAQIARARYGRVQAVKSYEDLYINISQDIRVGVDQNRTLWSAVAFYHDELLPQAERSLEFATAAWQAGTADILTLLVSQRELLATRRKYVSAHVAAAATLADLENAVGLPLDRILAAIEADRQATPSPNDGGAS